MANGLNLGKLDENKAAGANATYVPNIDTEVAILAIIKVHNELPKDEKGVASVTLRQLIDRFGSQKLRSDALLKEYVCAFGAHAEAVVRRVIKGYYGEDQGQLDWVETKVNDYYAKIKAALA